MSTIYHDLDGNQDIEGADLDLEEAEIEFNIQQGNISANISIDSIGGDGVRLEQAYAMYNVSESFAVTFGKWQIHLVLNPMKPLNSTNPQEPIF